MSSYVHHSFLTFVYSSTLPSTDFVEADRQSPKLIYFVGQFVVGSEQYLHLYLALSPSPFSSPAVYFWLSCLGKGESVQGNCTVLSQILICTSFPCLPLSGRSRSSSNLPGDVHKWTDVQGWSSPGDWYSYALAQPSSRLFLLTRQHTLECFIVSLFMLLLCLLHSKCMHFVRLVSLVLFCTLHPGNCLSSSSHDTNTAPRAMSLLLFYCWLLCFSSMLVKGKGNLS